MAQFLSWDWQAQVYYYGARFYDPKIANFLTEDPAHQGVNPYAYVGWNPVRFTDPTGMFNLASMNLYFEMGGAAFAAWYSTWSGGFAQNGALGMGACMSGAASGQGTGNAGGSFGAGMQGAVAAAVNAAISAVATAQGGNSTAAYPVLNQSVPGGAPLSQSGLPPGTPVLAGPGGFEAPGMPSGSSSATAGGPAVAMSSGGGMGPGKGAATLQGIAEMGAGIAMVYTGGLFVNQALVSMGEIQGVGGGVFGASAVTLAILNDAGFLAIGGGGVALMGGVAIGAGINDAVITGLVPGTPTFVNGVFYLSQPGNLWGR